jgi:hypothetical protein
MNPFDQLAAIAETQIGTEEDTRHTNSGTAILKYQQATSLGGQGWPWCAAFVDWCVEQFLIKFPHTTKVVLANRPRTAAAFGLRTWGIDNGCKIFHPLNNSTGNIAPSRSDLVVYSFSHCGIVSGPGSQPGQFQAIEGNTNNDGSRDGYEVCRRTRDFSRVLCFIRLPAAV